MATVLTAQQCACCLRFDVTTSPRIPLPVPCERPDVEHPGFPCAHVQPEAQPVMVCDECMGGAS